MLKARLKRSAKSGVPFPAAGALALALLACGCASTPKSRIQEKEAEFFAYPPEIQGQIQAGSIDKGFTEDMVYLAKGTPSEKTTTARGGKTVTVWKYHGKAEALSPAASAPTGFGGAYGYPGFGPAPQQGAPMVSGKPRLVIEFEEGKVTSWRE